jgi:hypothetical protein
MRRAILIGVMIAGAAGADVPPESRYQKDAWDLCRERHPIGLLDQCVSTAVEAASIFSAIERGVLVDLSYLLDDDPDRKKAQKLATECREMTMDGELVDVISALSCVLEEIEIRNWETRRAKRIQEEQPDGAR